MKPASLPQLLFRILTPSRHPIIASRRKSEEQPMLDDANNMIELFRHFFRLRHRP